MRKSTLSKPDYCLLASLHHALRGFQHGSQEAARVAGLTSQQHQALLAIKGFPGRDYVSIGELAERLLLRHHSAVGLVDGLALRHLVRRTRSASDRRRVELRLTARGETKLERLSAARLKEIRMLSAELRGILN